MEQPSSFDARRGVCICLQVIQIIVWS